MTTTNPIWDSIEPQLSALLDEKLKQHISALKKDSLEDYPDYLTRNQAAEILNIKPQTADTWVRRGIIRKFKIEGTTRFLKADLIEALKTHQRYQRG